MAMDTPRRRPSDAPWAESADRIPAPKREARPTYGMPPTESAAQKTSRIQAVAERARAAQIASNAATPSGQSLGPEKLTDPAGRSQIRESAAQVILRTPLPSPGGAAEALVRRLADANGANEVGDDVRSRLATLASRGHRHELKELVSTLESLRDFSEFGPLTSQEFPQSDMGRSVDRGGLES